MTMGAQNRSLRIWMLAGAAVALVGAGAYAAQNAGPKPPSLIYSGPVPSKFLIDPAQGSKFGVHDHMTISADVAEQKARTALLTREASHVITNRVYNDNGTLIRMQQFGLSPQQGGLPIIVNDQIIGAIGVGGGAGGEELCAQDALQKVFGPQPALLAAPRGAAPTANGVFAPASVDPGG